MSHNGKTTNSSGWNAVFSWIKYALTGKRDETKAVSQSSVSASSLVDLDARVKAIEKVLASLDVDDAEDLSVYKILQAAKTFSPDRTKTLSAMSQDANGEMSATFNEVQATVASQNNYTSPGSTKTALSTIFGKIWNFFGMLLKSTGTWNGSSDAQIPTTAAVQAKLDGKQDKFVAIVGTHGGNDGTSFNDIKTAFANNQDIVARRDTDSNNKDLFQLVKTVYSGGQVSYFVFQRSYPNKEYLDGQSTGVQGQLEQWTRSSTEWVRGLYPVEYSEVATTAITAQKYDANDTSAGSIKTALDGKQDKFVAIIGPNGGDRVSTFNDVKTAWLANQDIVARRVVSDTENALFQLVRTEYANGQVSKFVFQRSYPVSDGATLVRGQLEQWAITSSGWPNAATFLSVEFADNCTNAHTVDNYHLSVLASLPSSYSSDTIYFV